MSINTSASTDRIALRGRTVLITGVSRREGLGFALARTAAAEGAHVLLRARDGAQARRLAAELDTGIDGDVRGHELDIASAASIAALQRTIEQDHGHLDVLINNAAGANRFGETADTADLDSARAVMDVTVFGTWALLEAMLPLLRLGEHGRILRR